MMLMNGKLQPNEIRHAFFFKEIRAGITTFATMAYTIGWGLAYFLLIILQWYVE